MGIEIIVSGWTGIFRVIIVGALAYVALLLALRISGNRTLSRMHAFDMVVSVALGSTLATVILSKDVALAEGVAAFLLLIAMQFLISWLAVRSPRVRHLATAEPVILFYEGRFLHGQMRRSRVVEDEIYAAVRAEGIAELDDIMAVVLESDGACSVVPRSAGTSTAIGNVSRPASPPSVSFRG